MVHRHTQIVKFVTVILIIAPSFVLYGWAYNIDQFKSIVPGLVAMNPLTALSFMLIAVALWAACRPSSPSRARIVAVIGAVVASVGALVLLRYIFGLNITPDQVLFSGKLAGAAGSKPNQMAPNTALNFLLLGTSLFLIGLRRHRSYQTVEYLIGISLVSTILALIGYIYGTRYLYVVGSFIPMAAHTAACFVLLAVSLLLVLPQRKLATRAKRSFDNLSIRGKLISAFLVLILFMSVSSVYAVYTIDKAQTAIRERDEIIKTAEIAQQLDVDALRIMVLLQEYIDLKNPALLIELNEYRALAERHRTELRRLAHIPEVIKSLESYDKLLPARRDVADRLINGVNSGLSATQMSALRRERETYDAQARQYLREIMTLERISSDNALLASKQEFNTARRNIINFSLLALLGGAILSYFVARSMAAPIRRLTQMVGLIASGNYQEKVTNDAKDEIGILTRSFNDMVAALKDKNQALDRQVERIKKANMNLEASELIVREERDKTNLLLESIGDGIVALDRELNITMINRAASELTGWAPHEAAGRPVQEVLRLIRERDRSPDISFIQQAVITRSRQVMAENMLLITKSGKEVPVADSVAPLIGAHNEVEGAIIALRDATQEREAQRIKSDFAYASHQLRTPVAGALAAIQVASIEKDPAAAKADLAEAELAIESVNRLVTHLLAVSTLEQGMIPVKPQLLGLNELLAKTVADLQPYAAEHDATLKLHAETSAIPIHTDPELFKQVMSELVQNAANYAGGGGAEIDVRLTIQPSTTLIEVHNPGTPILEEELPLVFTKFFRGTGAKTVPGSGLGLYLARAYAQLLGGKVWFTSTPEAGTTFSFELPQTKG